MGDRESVPYILQALRWVKDNKTLSDNILALQEDHTKEIKKTSSPITIRK